MKIQLVIVTLQMFKFFLVHVSPVVAVQWWQMRMCLEYELVHNVSGTATAMTFKDNVFVGATAGGGVSKHYLFVKHV